MEVQLFKKYYNTKAMCVEACLQVHQPHNYYSQHLPLSPQKGHSQWLSWITARLPHVGQRKVHERRTGRRQSFFSLFLPVYTVVAMTITKSIIPKKADIIIFSPATNHQDQILTLYTVNIHISLLSLSKAIISLVKLSAFQRTTARCSYQSGWSFAQKTDNSDALGL